MEEFFPFLAGLAYMAYRIYDNFKKAQEEARKRNISQPYREEPQETSYTQWPEPEELYIPQPAAEYKAEKYSEPKYEPPYREPLVEKVSAESRYQEEKTAIPQKVELFNPEIPAEEVRSNKAIHAPHKHAFVASHEEEIEYSDFDFRDAVIKEAILNRPQY